MAAGRLLLLCFFFLFLLSAFLSPEYFPPTVTAAEQEQKRENPRGNNGHTHFFARIWEGKTAGVFFLTLPAVVLGPRLFRALVFIVCLSLLLRFFRHRRRRQNNVSRSLLSTLSPLVLLLLLSVWAFPALWFPPNTLAERILSAALSGEKGIEGGTGESLPVGRDFSHYATACFAQLCADVLLGSGLAGLVCPVDQGVAWERLSVSRVDAQEGHRYEQVFDVFSPSSSASSLTSAEGVVRSVPGHGTRPVLVFFHGGGYVVSFKWAQGLPVLTELARRGWVCVSVGYRLVAPGPRPASLWICTALAAVVVASYFGGRMVPSSRKRGALVIAAVAVAGASLILVWSRRHNSLEDSVEDSRLGLSWAHEHATRWGGNSSVFLGVMGLSAGGHLATLLSLDGPSIHARGPAADQKVSGGRACDALVALYPVTNILDGEWYIHEPLFRMLVDTSLLRTAGDRGAKRTFSPLYRAREAPRDPPPNHLFVHGAEDTLVPVSHSRTMVKELRRLNRTATLAEIPLAEHAFDIFPTSSAGVESANAVISFLEREHWRKLMSA
jgi:acetyl esterase/lipase